MILEPERKLKNHLKCQDSASLLPQRLSFGYSSSFNEYPIVIPSTESSEINVDGEYYSFEIPVDLKAESKALSIIVTSRFEEVQVALRF